MGLANYLLEKAAGLKQVKRMLEAAAKSPEARHKLALLPNNFALPEGTLLHGGSAGIELYHHRRAVESAIETSQRHGRQLAAKKKGLLPDVSYSELQDAVASNITDSKKLINGVRQYTGTDKYPSSWIPETATKAVTPTSDQQALNTLHQQLGRKGLRVFEPQNHTVGPVGSVDVFDLGPSRPKDKVGVSSPHTTRSPLFDTRRTYAGPQPNIHKNWQHLPDDPKYPGSHIAKLKQEYEGVKPLGQQDLFGGARDRGGSNTDPRFETVVDAKYLADRKVGEFTQFGVKPNNGSNLLNFRGLDKPPTLGTSSSRRSTSTPSERIQANLTGTSSYKGSHKAPDQEIHGVSVDSPVAVQRVAKSRQAARYTNRGATTTVTAPAEFSPLHVNNKFSDNVGMYSGATEWKNYPADARFVGKGRHPDAAPRYSEGSPYWTSQLLTAVPPNYANHMDLSRGNLYYKTSNPKSFGKAMNKYLDKPIEGS